MPFITPADWKPARIQPVERSTVLSVLLFVVTCGSYGVYWTFRVHEEHPRRPGDPTGLQALLHPFLPCLIGIPLLIACKGQVRPEYAKAAGMLHIWWLAMLCFTYANVAYAYVGWRLTGRFYEMWLTRDAEQAARMKEGAFSLIIAIGIWSSRNLVMGLDESGFPVPEILLQSFTQSILRGLSVGLAIRWWYGIHRAANAFSHVNPAVQNAE